MTEQDQPQDSQQPVLSAPPAPATVSQCKLVLRSVRLVSLLFAQANQNQPAPEMANIRISGKLSVVTDDGAGFKAEISWSLDVPDTPAPVTIAGKHELTFGVSRPIDRFTREYYAETNAVVLVYPYVRQVIDELSSRCYGRGIMIPPLDVQDFVKRRLEEKAKELKDQVAELAPSSDAPGASEGAEPEASGQPKDRRDEDAASGQHSSGN